MSGQKALFTRMGPHALISKLRCRFSGVTRVKLVSAAHQSEPGRSLTQPALATAHLD